MYYILDENKNPVKVTVDEWAAWYEPNRLNGRVVRQDHNVNGYYVSTVFLGLDHSFGESDVPILWETMIFKEDGGFSDLYCDRYSSYEAALEGHLLALTLAEKGEL